MITLTVEAVLVADIAAYITRRQAQLASLRDAAQSPVDKGKIIGMLQALADFEGMIRQLRVTPAASPVTTAGSLDIPQSCDALACRWLSGLGVADATLDDFKDDTRQNKALARHPRKRGEIILLGQLVRNRGLIDAVLSNIHDSGGGNPLRMLTARAPTAAPNGGACPHCGKRYK